MGLRQLQMQRQARGPFKINLRFSTAYIQDADKSI